MSDLSLSDLRRQFFGGGTDQEYDLLRDFYDAGKTAVDLLNTTDLLGFWPAGAYLQPQHATSTQATTLNQARLTPMVIPKARTITELAMEVTTGGAAGAVVRAGIYDSDSNGRPGALLADLGTQVSTGVGIITFPANLTLPPGLIWIAGVSQVAVCTLRSVVGSSRFITNTTLAASSDRASFLRAGVSGALPSPMDSLDLTGNNAGFWAALKAAA